MRALLLPLLIATMIPFAVPASATCTSTGETIGIPGGGSASYLHHECSWSDSTWWSSSESTQLAVSEAYTGLTIGYRHSGYGYGYDQSSSESEQAVVWVGSTKGNVVPSASVDAYDYRQQYGDSCYGGSGANGRMSWGGFSQAVGGPLPVGGCSGTPSLVSLLP